MKQVFFIAIVGLAVFLSTPFSVSAALSDNLVPQNTGDVIGDVPLFYNEYSPNHYRLETYVDTSGDWMPWNWDDGVEHAFYLKLNEIINTLWMHNIILSNFTMKVVQEAFALNFVQDVIQQLEQAIQQTAGIGPGGFQEKGIWPLLVTLVLTLAGTWAAYVGMVKRQLSRAWGGLVSTLLVFVFALGFFSNAGTILGGINHWTSEVKSDVLAISASIVNPSASYNQQEGIATIHNQMFDLMVKKPYILMQYGTLDVEKKRVKDLLELSPTEQKEAEDRETAVKNEVEIEENVMMSLGGVMQRLGFIPLLFVSNTIVGLVLLIVSGSIILYQVAFIALALFAPIPLLMALVPRWQQAAITWLMKVVHTQLMQIGISFFLIILFVISNILYKASLSSDMGYVWMMVLQIICFAGITTQRRYFFAMVSTITNHVQSTTGQSLQNTLRRYYQVKAISHMGSAFTGGRKGPRPLPLANRRAASQGSGRIATITFPKRTPGDAPQKPADMKPYIEKGKQQPIYKNPNAYKEKNPNDLQGVERNGSPPETGAAPKEKEAHGKELQRQEHSPTQEHWQHIGRQNSAKVEDRVNGPLPEHLTKDTANIKTKANYQEHDLARAQSRAYVARHNSQQKIKHPASQQYQKEEKDLHSTAQKSKQPAHVQHAAPTATNRTAAQHPSPPPTNTSKRA
ncbi:CD3337/EF1877 family mobilome membrane protein [Thalassobacillus pellis]|uniref:CD3337/EF1877 family mobilome membrane protein n=1 Tax=Thalassobacillus pellis TaxID=748008 RepID=UPI0019621398|nr:hypothetical protein [Thalassobacillus pellis]MBM7554569.1 hypothetical protein [Thalassobacillus pellis]